MVVNDNAGSLVLRSVPDSIASRLDPTGYGVFTDNLPYRQNPNFSR